MLAQKFLWRARDSIILTKPRTPPPSLKFLFSHPAHLVACGFGSGLAPVAPGTFGTLFGWLAFLPLRQSMSDVLLLAVIAMCFFVGIGAVHKSGKDLGVVDHGSMVWDEVVPFWLVLFFVPTEWAWQLAAFALFRLFDITKPPPASYFDRRVKNGFGVMMDDLCAAGYSIAVLLILRMVIG